MSLKLRSLWGVRQESLTYMSLKLLEDLADDGDCAVCNRPFG